MTNFIQEIKNHNINKALSLEMVFRTSDEDFNKSIDEVADTLNKSFLDGLVDEQTVEIDFKNLDAILEKARPHKYYKREGSPGNYKYYYTKEEYEKEKKGNSGGDKLKEANRLAIEATKASYGDKLKMVRESEKIAKEHFTSLNDDDLLSALKGKYTSTVQAALANVAFARAHNILRDEAFRKHSGWAGEVQTLAHAEKILKEKQEQENKSTPEDNH